MSITDSRLLIHTNRLLQAYLQNGTLPDELLVQEQIEQEFAPFFDPVTNTFNINGPLWQPSNIAYRQVSNAALWNKTQTSAAEDTAILYEEFLDDLNTLTTSLFDYVSRANLIRNRITNLVSRINNLLLLSTSTDGFIFSFFDNFVDTTKVDFSTPGLSTSALVNTATHNTQLPLDITTDITGAHTTTSILNLLFLQPNDVRFAVLNPVASQVSLSNASLTDIFTNQANAWQKQITISGQGPLVAELTVKVSTLEPILINKIEMNTKMSNYANQILVQVLTSEDGISYNNISSANNPQFIGQSAEFNFTPVFASFVKFIITKNVADTGSTYNLGFQYISFQQVQYSLTADLFSIPITFPDNRPISKVAIETCTIEPTNTEIDYFILRPSGNPIPISPDTEKTPLFPKIINLGALTDVEQIVSTSGDPLVWSPEPSGRFSINVTTLAAPSPINISDITIPNTMSIFRALGGSVAAEPSGIAGWQSNPSGLPTDYFQTYMNIANLNGTHLDLGSSQAFIDGTLSTGAVTLDHGLHKLATTAFDKLQEPVAMNSDEYFTWNLQFKSVFEFYNNFSSVDPSIFTYDPLSGKIIINGVEARSQTPSVDFANSFVLASDSTGQFLSSATAVPTSSFTNPPVINAGSSIDITVGPNPQWINEVQLRLNAGTNTTLSVLASVDNITFFTVLDNQLGPLAGATSFGSLRFNTPVYAKYFKLLFITGSNVTMTGGYVDIFPPIFLNAGTIRTVQFFLPSASIWSSIQDAIHVNALQSYQVFNGFDNMLVNEYTPSSWIADITGLYVPKVYVKVKANSMTLDPYISLVTFNSRPLLRERSQVMFSFLAPGGHNPTNSIRFNARLISNHNGITPQLSSYRVKLL